MARTRRPGPPPGCIEVVVEIPSGSRNKYEIDDVGGQVWLDRQLFTATRYPADYGFVPGTLGEDGDPLDALVLLNDPTFPGVHLWARPVGVFEMEDEAGPDHKILAVPYGDPRWEDRRDLPDMPRHLLEEIEHFFDVYKALEPGKSTTVGAWHGRARAEELVTAAYERAAAR